MLKPKQRKCLELMVRGDLTQTQIAGQIKVSVQTITNWKKEEEFIKAYETMMKQGISSLAAKAFRTLSELLNANSEMVRFTAAKDILDRAGFKGEEKVNVSIDKAEKLDDIINQLGGEGLEE